MGVPTQAILEECVAGGQMDRIHAGLDLFDASINRIAAWAIGAPNAKRASLCGLLQPKQALRAAEYCGRDEKPRDHSWLADFKRYEVEVLNRR